MTPGAQGIYTMPNSPIKNLADLEGRTVAINASRNILYLLAASVLAEHGISPSRVHFTDVPFPGMTGALKSYPVSNGPVGTVDKVRLQRVVDVMQQFLGFPSFNIDSMPLNGR